MDKRRELLQVKKQLHEAEHQLATVALGSSNTQAPPSSSAQAPPGLSIQSGTPVALQPQHGVFNAILPEKMLAPINIHCEQTGTSPMSGSSATPPVVAMPERMGAMETVQEVMQKKLYKLEAIQKQLHDKKQQKEEQHVKKVAIQEQEEAEQMASWHAETQRELENQLWETAKCQEQLLKQR